MPHPDVIYLHLKQKVKTSGADHRIRSLCKQSSVLLQQQNMQCTLEVNIYDGRNCLVAVCYAVSVKGTLINWQPLYFRAVRQHSSLQ